MHRAQWSDRDALRPACYRVVVGAKSSRGNGPAANTVASAIGVVVVACGAWWSCSKKASKEAHALACDRFGEIHVEAAVSYREAQGVDDEDFSPEGLQSAHKKRCMMQTAGAKKSFVECIDAAEGTAEADDCVKSHRVEKRRDEDRARERRRKDRRKRKRRSG